MCQATNGFLNEVMGPGNLYGRAPLSTRIPTLEVQSFFLACSGSLVEDSVPYSGVSLHSSSVMVSIPTVAHLQYGEGM